MSDSGAARRRETSREAAWKADIERRLQKLERVGTPPQIILLEPGEGAEAVPPETLYGTIIVRKRAEA